MKKLMMTAAIALAMTSAQVAQGGILDLGGTLRGDFGRAVNKVEKPVTKAIEDTVKGAAQIAEDSLKGAVAVSGLKTVEDLLIEGKSLEQSLDEVLDDAKSAISAQAAIPALLNHSLNAVTEVTGNVLGESAQDVVGVVLVPATIAANFPSAITDTVLKTTENVDNAQDVVGIPLNAAFKAVLQYYEGKGKPLPEVLIRFLPPTFDKAHLESVRYIVDDSTGNLAGLINSLQTQFGSAEGGNHAVTVGNLIIFDKEPSPGIADLFFWAHEIQHTVQYATKGMDTFAAEYVTDYKGLEDDANNVALKAVEDVKTLLLMASNG